MNSFYGVLGTPGCRFFDPKLASSITLRGHEIITKSQAFIERTGRKVIYGDTDSLFVWIEGEATERACLDIGNELASSLNAYWSAELATHHRTTSCLEVEFETHYHRFLMPTIRHSDRGSKKRYAGTVRSAQGDIELVIKGLEAARTDWTPLARRLQRELYLRVFTDLDWRAWLTHLIEGVRAGRHDDELVYRKRLRRPLDAYEKNVPPQVQAARKLGGKGRMREIQYVMTAAGPEPIDLPHARLDYDHYIEKQLAPAADGLLSFLETSLLEVTGAQLSLFGG
jgi:DNA polymerase-2